MTRSLIFLALASTAISASAQAQTAPPSGVDPHRYQTDQHRHAIERLRDRADQREAFARQLQLETRLNRLEIEAARQNDLAPGPSSPALRSPEEERAARESATRRRRAVTSGVGQIDDWLDRSTR